VCLGHVTRCRDTKKKRLGQAVSACLPTSLFLHKDARRGQKLDSKEKKREEEIEVLRRGVAEKRGSKETAGTLSQTITFLGREGVGEYVSRGQGFPRKHHSKTDLTKNKT